MSLCSVFLLNGFKMLKKNIEVDFFHELPFFDVFAPRINRLQLSQIIERKSIFELLENSDQPTGQPYSVNKLSILAN